MGVVVHVPVHGIGGGRFVIRYRVKHSNGSNAHSSTTRLYFHKDSLSDCN